MKFNNETLRAAVKEWLDDESKAEKKYGHISDWDTSEVTDMEGMFERAKSFNQPLEKWDVSKVTSMKAMFALTKSFNQPLEKWDVSQVTDMRRMFDGASSFNQPLEKWDVSNVTDMSNMFDGASSFNQPLEKLDVSKVTTMLGMFDGASSFNQPLEKWDVSHVTDMSWMFYMATSFNQPLEKWDVSKVKDMKNMFSHAKSFNQPLEKWDVSQVTHMSKMFAGAISFAHHVPKKNSENSSTRKMEVYIENLDKKTTLERFAKDWLYSEQEVQEIREELEDSGYWDDGRCEMEMKDDHIEVSIWPDEVETYGCVNSLYPDEFLLLHYHIENRDEDEFTGLSIQNQSELLSNIVFKGGESDKKSRLNEDELAVFNQSEDTDCGGNVKYKYQLFIKKEDFFKTGWNGVIKTIGLDIE